MRDWRGKGVEGDGREGEFKRGRGCHIQHFINVEDINKEKHKRKLLIFIASSKEAPYICFC